MVAARFSSDWTDLALYFVFILVLASLIFAADLYQVAAVFGRWRRPGPALLLLFLLAAGLALGAKQKGVHVALALIFFCAPLACDVQFFGIAEIWYSRLSYQYAHGVDLLVAAFLIGLGTCFIYRMGGLERVALILFLIGGSYTLSVFLFNAFSLRQRTAFFFITAVV